MAEAHRCSSLLGWSFLGVAEDDVEYKKQFHCAAVTICRDSRFSTVETLLAQNDPNAAYRTIHAIIRDAWEQSGASIRLCDVNKSNGNGSRLLLCRLIPAMIQKQSAHRKNGSGFRSIDLNLAAACARARQRYRRIRDQKKKQF